MKTLIWIKDVIGAGGIVQPIGKPFEVEDDKEADVYIAQGIAELAPAPEPASAPEPAAKK